MDLRTRLESHDVKTLKSEVRKVKAGFNYGRLKKAELIELMLKNKDKFNHIKMAEKKERKKPVRKEPVKKRVKIKRKNNYEKLLKLLASKGEKEKKDEALKDFYSDVDILDNLQALFEDEPLRTEFLVKSGNRKGFIQARYLKSAVSTLRLLKKKEVMQDEEVMDAINNAEFENL